MALDYEYVTRAERLSHIANEGAQSEVLALDLETTPKPEWRHLEWAALSPHTGRIRLCSVNTGKKVYVIDVFQTKTLGPLKALLHNPTQATGKGHPVIVGQNLKFDQAYLYAHEGIELWPVFDTFRASSLLYNGQGTGLRGIGHNLYDLYARELGMRPVAEDLGGSDWGADVLTKQQLDYAAEDVTFLPDLRRVLRPKLERAGLFKIAAIEFGSILPEAAVEVNGFPIDMDAWMKVAETNHAKMIALAKVLIRELPNPFGQMLLPGASEWVFDENALYRWAVDVTVDEDGNRTERERTEEEQIQARKAAKSKGRKDKLTFNLDSTEQMLMSLHRMGGKLRMLDSTREMALAMFASEYPIISKLLEYRGYATKLKSFGPEYREYINPVTGRIHPNYFPMLVTGRFAAKNPNLGQIPREKEYRSCFKAPPGWRFVIADYSGVEMRLAAEISGDRTLIHLFQHDLDPHRYTASKLLQKPEDQITKAERQQAKPCIAEGQLVLTNHGLKPIECVDLSDLVWDGVEWVAHEGVVYKGYQEVMTYDGLTATPEHKVWLRDGRCVSLRTAASALEGGRLAVGGDGEVPIGYAHVDGKRGAGWQEERAVRRSDVLDLLHDISAVSVEYPHGQDYELSVPAGSQVQARPTGGGSGRAVRRDGAAVPGAGERALQELRSPWDRAAFRVAGALHSLDARACAASDLSRSADRPAGQRRALRAGEPAVGFAAREPTEQAHQSLGGLLRRASVVGGPVRSDSGRLSSVYLGPRDDRQLRELAQAEPDTRRGTPAGRRGRSGSQGSTFARVYDIVNAGPRNRFVVSNRVVANCNFGFLYGMQPEKFVLYAMTGYGVKLTLDQSTQYRNRFFDEYTGLREWHEVTLRQGKKTHMTSTPLGRLRYCDETAHNEYLNHPVQGAGADGLKRALREVYRRSCKYNGDVLLVHHVHDEIITQVRDDADLVKAWEHDMKEGMESAMSGILTRVPALAEPGNGYSWADK